MGGDACYFLFPVFPVKESRSSEDGRLRPAIANMSFNPQLLNVEFKTMIRI